AGAPLRATAPSEWLVCLGLPRRCVGEPAVTDHKSVSQAGTTRSRVVAAQVGVTSDEAENAPRLRVTNGEDSQESKPPVKRRVKTHSASLQYRLPPVLWRGFPEPEMGVYKKPPLKQGAQVTNATSGPGSCRRASSPPSD